MRGIGESERSGGTGVEIREMGDADLPAVLALLAASLGWSVNETYAAFFAWKHRDNPFGRSPAWVAADEAGRILGFRTFLRWEFEQDGRTVRAMRAVDTATHPDAQGQGIFTRLTRHALEAVRAEGVEFVFNTPNAQSRPGYLKMGWVPVGRLPARARLLRPGAFTRVPRAGVPAERQSVPTSVGEPAADVLADERGVADLLAAQPPATGLRTKRTPAYLRWRYGSLSALGYRAVPAPRGAAEGIAIFRLRRRGPAVEAAVADVIVPDADPRLAATLLRRVAATARAARADYALALGTTPGAVRAGFLRLPRAGPLLTFRPLIRQHPPAPAAWDLTLGDIELF